MSTAPADPDAWVTVSTRQLFDVATRVLRTRGLSYAAARAAADVVEELEAAEGTGVLALEAALRRPVAWRSPDGSHIDAAGSSALLITETLVDLLCLHEHAMVTNVGEPHVLVSALRRTSHARGDAWVAQWSTDDGTPTGGCAATPGGQTHRWGKTVPEPQSLTTLTVRVDRREGDGMHPAAARLADLSAALSTAHHHGLVIRRSAWTPLATAAQAFLVGAPEG